MVTVVVRLRLDLPSVGSLKEKRRILKSLTTRIHNMYNVSIAEIGENDRLRTAILGVAVVSNSTSHAHEVMSKLVNRVEQSSETILTDYTTEVY